MRFTRQPQYPARIDNSNILAQSLKMLYPLGGGWGLLDATGNTVGTVSGGPLSSFMAPQIGGLATTFNGSTQYITTNWAGILGSGAVTVSCWFRTSSAATCPIVSWGAYTTGSAFQVSVESGVIWGRFSSVTCSFGSGFNDGNWHCLVFIKPAGVSAAGCLVYVDGKSIAIASSSGTATISPAASYNVRIGVFVGTPSAWFNGQLADIQINSSQWGTNHVKAIQKNPWQIFQFPKKRVLEALSGTAVNLTGSETQKQSGSAALSVSVPLVAASVQKQTEHGTLNAGVSLVGSATAKQSADGALQVSVPLNAEEIQRQSGSGTLKVSVTLAGNEIQKAYAQGTLTNTPAGSIALAGTETQHQSASGLLSIGIHPSGSSVSIQSASGTLSTIVHAIGSEVQAQRASGALIVSVDLSGAELQKAFAQATLTNQTSGIHLAGEEVQKQSAQASMTLRINLIGEEVQKAAASGYLSLSGQLSPNPLFTVQSLGRKFAIQSKGRNFSIQALGRKFSTGL